MHKRIFCLLSAAGAQFGVFVQTCRNHAKAAEAFCKGKTRVS